MKVTASSSIMVKGFRSSNGTDEHPAIITRVWSTNPDTANGPVLVNATVFLDYGVPAPASSIPLYESRAEAEAEQERVNAIESNREFYRAKGVSGMAVAFWPDRV